MWITDRSETMNRNFSPMQSAHLNYFSCITYCFLDRKCYSSIPAQYADSFFFSTGKYFASRILNARIKCVKINHNGKSLFLPFRIYRFIERKFVNDVYISALLDDFTIVFCCALVIYDWWRNKKTNSTTDNILIIQSYSSFSLDHFSSPVDMNISTL